MVGDSVTFGPASNCVTPPFKAYDAVVALELDIAKEDVPNNEPVNPWVAITEPVTWKVLPEANTKLLLAPTPVPFPIMKADCADEEMLYWPCTCW